MNTDKNKQTVLLPKGSFFRDAFFSFRRFFLSTQNTIGIDVGSGYIKIVQLQKGNRGYSLTDYKVAAIPFKLKLNSREKDRFIKNFIKEYIKESRIKTSLGRMAVKGGGVFIFSFALPDIPDRDLRGAVGIELKKKLPFHLNPGNIFFDYYVTEKYEDPDPYLFVTCIAADNSVLIKHIELLKSSGLRPVLVNTNADALGNLIRAMKAPRYAGVLDMGARQSCLNFYKDGLLQLSREIPVGGDHLTQAVFKLISELKEDVVIDDAEVIKRHCGIPIEGEMATDFCTDFGVIKGSRIAGALRPVLERLITEIYRTLNFHFRICKFDVLDVLYLTGGASRIKNIEEFLQANLGNVSIKSIERLNPLSVVKGWVDSGVFKQELIMEEAGPYLSVALGLCVNNKNPVNLIPAREKLEQRALFLMFLARLTLPLIIVLTLIFYGLSYARVFVYRTIMYKTEAQINQFTPLVNEIKEYMAFKKILEERESLLQKAIGRQPLWWGIFKELSLVTPEEVTLHSLEVRAGEHPKVIIIEGEVLSEFSNLDLAVAQYTLNLGESPYFSRVKPLSTERDMYSAIPKARFKISCELVY